ncbi:MAG: hypothetical protein ACRDI2_01005 [Chloroflexota bacterium]
MASPDRLFLKALVIMVVKRLPRVGTLLWVLDGDDTWRGRLYEVGRTGWLATSRAPTGRPTRRTSTRCERT